MVKYEYHSPYTEDVYLISIYPWQSEKCVVIQKGYAINTVLVKHNHEYTFRLLKTRIEANGGVDGLLEFIKRCSEKNIMHDLAKKILDHALYSCRPFVV